MKFKPLSSFAKYAWGLLVYNLFIILWGAYVRASGSGAGCGAHWPTCNGEVIPRSPGVETIIEFTHRVTSGFALIFVLALLVWAWRKYPRRHPIRWSAALAVFFTITEALIGARLVLFGLVADNASLDRAYAMMMHLVNTFLLTGFIAITAWWATGEPPKRLHFRSGEGGLFVLSILALCVLGASGAIAALGDTLFPSSSLLQGLQDDFSAEAHLLTRLRVYHPLVAVLTGLFVVFLANRMKRKYADARLGLFANIVTGLFVVQLALGVINVALLAPIWMQLVHLLAADLVWLSLVLLVTVFFGAGDLLPRLADDEVHQRVDEPKRIG